MGSRVFKLCRVSIIIRTYNLSYCIWHISAGFCSGSVKSVKKTLNCFEVPILGRLFFCTERKCRLLGVHYEGGKILEQIVYGIAFCAGMQCLVGLCPGQPALADAA